MKNDKLWRGWENDVDQILRSQIEQMHREAKEAEDTSSPEFLAKMNELLGKNSHKTPGTCLSRKHPKLARVACIAAIFTVLMGASQLNPNADWNINKLFNKVYDEYILSSSNEDVELTAVGAEVNNQIAKQFPGVFVLTKLPDGYELVSKKGQTEDSLTLTYSNGENNIVFQQNKYQDIAGDDKIDNDIETITENGVKYLYSEKDEGKTESSWLEWKSGDTEFYLLSSLERSNLVKMAESVKKLD